MDLEKKISEILNDERNEKKYIGASGCTYFEGERLWLKKINKYPHPRDNSFRVEAQIYEHVLSQINVINLCKYYGTFLNGTVIALEKIDGTNLYYLADKLSFSDLLKVIIQLLYTLICFEKKGLYHNDLNTQNVIIQKLDTETVFIYKYKNRKITFETKYLLKIIDFEKASIYHDQVERNFSESPERIGEDSRDIYVFLSCLYNTGKNNDFNDWLKKTFPLLVNSFPKNSFSHIYSYITPKKYVNTENLFLFIVQNFKELFWTDLKAPNNDSKIEITYGDIDNIDIDYLIYKYLNPDNFHIVRELANLGYNWLEESNNLFQKLCEKYPEISKEVLIEGSFWLSNPIKLREPSLFEKEAGKDYTCPISIPQKLTENMDIRWTSS